MNILFENYAYKPAYALGGPIYSVSALAEALVRRGHNVTVFTTNAADANGDLDIQCDVPHLVDGVTVHYFRRDEPLKRMLPFIPYLSQSVGLFHSRSLAQRLRQGLDGFDIVHTHHPYTWTHLAVSRAAIRAGLPLFYHQRGSFAESALSYRALKKRIAIGLFEKPIMRRAACLVALNPYERTTFAQWRLDTPIAVIPNGIDLSTGEFPADPATLDTLGIPPAARVILFMARLHWIKGAEFLVEAFISAAADMPDCHLVIAGADEQGRAAELRRSASNAGLGTRIHIVGHVQGPVKKALLDRAELFCQPSRSEGFSISVLEALASGTPAMISDKCNFDEVADAGCGWVLPLDATRWTETLRAALLDADELKRKGERGRDLVRERYTWDSIAGEIEELYLTKKSYSSFLHHHY